MFLAHFDFSITFYLPSTMHRSRSPSPYRNSADDRSRSPSIASDYNDGQDSRGMSLPSSPDIAPSSPPLGPDGQPDWRSLRTSGPYANRGMAHHQHRVLRSASRSSARDRGDSVGSDRNGTVDSEDIASMSDELDIMEVDDESEYMDTNRSRRRRTSSRSSSNMSRSSSGDSISDGLSSSDGHDRTDGTDDDDDLFASTLGSDFLDLFARDGLIGGDDSDSDELPSPMMDREANKGGSSMARHSPIRIGGRVGHGEDGGATYSLGSARGSNHLNGPTTTVIGVSSMSLTPRPASVGPPSGGVGLGSIAPSSGNRRATTAMVFD